MTGAPKVISTSITEIFIKKKAKDTLLQRIIKKGIEKSFHQRFMSEHAT